MAKKQVAEDEAKPTNDAYTGMLAISLIALIVGCVMLYLDFNQYGTEPPPVVQTAAPPPPAAAPAAPAPAGQPAVDPAGQPMPMPPPAPAPAAP